MPCGHTRLLRVCLLLSIFSGKSLCLSKSKPSRLAQGARAIHWTAVEFPSCMHDGMAHLYFITMPVCNEAHAARYTNSCRLGQLHAVPVVMHIDQHTWCVVEDMQHLAETMLSVDDTPFMRQIDAFIIASCSQGNV